MASKLFQYLGLSYYLKSPSCSRSTNPYTPIQGWNKLCPSNTTLGTLTGPVCCYLDYTCSTVDCCVDVDTVGRNMTASLSVDSCHQKITLQLERLTKEISLLNYTWGMPEQYSLLGVFRANLTVHDLAAEDNYLLNLNLHVCFETTGSCVFSSVILSNVKLPKTKCDWSAGKDFFLSKWLAERGLTEHRLPQWAVYQLTEDLGISRFLTDRPCYNVTSQFMESPTGWNSECTNDVIVPDITGNGVVCSVSSVCTGLTCCIDIPLLQTSVKTYVSIDNCRNTLHLQIEELQTKIKLDEVSYGTENTFSLFGAVKIIYQIEKLSRDKAYQLNVNLSVCYETGRPCHLNLQVFNNTVLNTTTCNIADGFLDKAFSLTKWLSDRGLDPSSPSSDVTANELIIKLGLDDYMGTTNKCDLTTYPYSSAVKGWNDGKQEELQLHGVFRLKFAVNNIPSKSQFTVDIDISVCFEAKASPCSTVYSIMKTSELLHASCDISNNMMPFKGISFDFWKQTECTIQKGSDSVTGCPAAADGQTFECCMPLTFRSGRRNVNVKFTVTKCDEIQYSVERKQWTKAGLASGALVESERLGEAFQLNYTLTNNVGDVSIKMTIQACYLAQQESCHIYDLTPKPNVIGIRKPACSGRRRKRREATEPDPTNFHEGMRILTERKASSDEIEAYVKTVQKYEHEQKLHNLEGGEISDGDSKTGPRSALKALGKNNPAAIVASGEVASSSPVNGGSEITSMMGGTTDIKGRTKQTFIVGKGLTNAGVKLLGEKLANMTIGDLTSLFEMKNIDPILIYQLGKQLKELAKALLTEFIDVLMNGQIANILQSFDVPLKGDFSFPKQRVNFFPPLHLQYPLGGFIIMTFDFGSGAYYGMKFEVGVKLMSMKGYAQITPYGGVEVWGELVPWNVNLIPECHDLPRPVEVYGRQAHAHVIGGLDRNRTGLLWCAFAFESTTSKSQSYFEAYKDYLKWEELITKIRTDLKSTPYLQSIFQTSKFWPDVMMEVVAVNSAIYSLVLSMVICLVAVAIFSGHVMLLFIVFVTILEMICLVTGLFYLAGWEMGGVEAISLSILVGSSVDYCVHLVEGFLLAGKAVPDQLKYNNAASRQWRTKAAVSHIGVSIFSSAMTTIVAAIPLTQATIQPFAKFGQILAINSTVSIIYCLTVCSALLAFMGPSKFISSWKSTLKITIGTCVVVGSSSLLLFVISKCVVFIPGPNGAALFPN